jgi:hypothetical protein
VVPVQILPPQVSPGGFKLGFNTISNRSYTVQSATNLVNPNWTFFTNVTGNGSLMQFTPAITNGGRNFFGCGNRKAVASPRELWWVKDPTAITKVPEMIVLEMPFALFPRTDLFAPGFGAVEHLGGAGGAIRHEFRYSVIPTASAPDKTVGQVDLRLHP